MPCDPTPSQGHSAHVGQDVVVHYQWHPLHGRCVRRHYSERRADGEIVHLESAPGVVTIVAAWMLDPVACVGTGLEAPRVSPATLSDLHHLLTNLGFRRDSLDDSNLVQEGNDEVCETRTAVGRTPTVDRAGFGEASGDDPSRAPRGDCAAGRPSAGSRRRRTSGERR
jgi:hypothetical protein